MSMLQESVQKLHGDEEGAGATEYIVLLILIACVIIAVVTRFGKAVDGKFDTASQMVEKDLCVDGNCGPPSFDP